MEDKTPALLIIDLRFRFTRVKDGNDYGQDTGTKKTSTKNLAQVLKKTSLILVPMIVRFRPTMAEWRAIMGTRI